jgi:hypothetical protein
MTHGEFTTPTPAESTGALSDADMAKLQEMETAAGDGTEEAERPSWLPDKFLSPEAMATAYHELEHRLGQAPTETPAPAATAEVDEGSSFNGAFWEEAAKSYADTGGITEEQLKTMTAAGIPQGMVDTYMTGLQAIIAQQEAEVMTSVGGQEEYSAMMEWAAKTLSPEDQATHNRAVDAGDAEAAKMAIRGLHAQYKQASAGGPNMITGSAPKFGGIEPFEDRSQVTAAIRDHRYKTSPAYRAEVEQRLAVSEIFETSK